jgi:hypothetical protein
MGQFGDTRSEFSCESMIYPMLPPTAGDVVPFLDLGQQRRDVGGVVLQVPVQ